MENTPLSELRENKPLQIRHAGDDEWSKSRVEGLLGAHLQVGWPIDSGRLLPYREGDRVELGFTLGGSFFIFSMPVVKASRRPVPTLVVPRPLPEELHEFKRRTAPRVTALMPISYEVEGVTGGDHSLLLSLSVSGLAFNARHPVTPKNRLLMEIHLPGATASLSAYGEVVASTRVPQSPSERYKIRVKFLQLSQYARDQVAKFVKERHEALDEMGME